MNTKINTPLLLLLALTFVCAFPVNAQVTIGSNVTPNPNALLDLKENPVDSTSTKGILLPRVELSSITSPVPMQAHVAGMFVYNTANNAGSDITPGIYFNDGTKWVRASSGTEWYVAGTANDAQSDKAGVISRNGPVVVYSGPNPTTAAAAAAPNSGLNIISESANDGADDLTIETFSGNSGAPTPAIFIHHNRGTRTAPQPLNNGEAIGSLYFSTMSGPGSSMQAYYKGDGTTNLSDLHFRTSGIPRMTFDENGNVGIGTTTPATKLEVYAGNAPGTGFKMADGTQQSGYVMTSDATGVAQWKPVGVKMIEGNYDATYNIDSIPFQAIQKQVSGHNITLPPGKWKVDMAAVLAYAGNKTAPIPDGEWAWCYLILTDDPSAVSLTGTPDVPASKAYVSMLYRSLKPTTNENCIQYATTTGYWPVTNNSGADKTYWVYFQLDRTSVDMPNSYLYDVLRTQYENKLVAIPILE